MSQTFNLSGEAVGTIPDTQPATNPEIALNTPHRPFTYGLPPEVLGEIFFRSLPAHPMVHRQPDVTVAPMLLCHVCSYWRAVAVGMQQLWENLFYSLSVYPPGPAKNLSLDQNIRPDDLKFLRWWRRKLGNKSVNLRFVVRWFKDYPEDWGEKGDTESFMRLILSARSLDVDKGFACALRMHLGTGFLSSTSKTSTFFLREGSGGFRGVLRNFPQDIPFGPRLTPFSTTHPVRRIFLEAMTIKERNVAEIQWTHLTHAILMNVAISTQAWFLVTGECVHLESAIFHIQGCTEPGHVGDAPNRTLPRLRRLVVKWDPSEFKQPIFQNLYLPALTGLRLHSCLSINELHQLLKSTPSVKELHLSYRIPADPDHYSKRGLLPSPGSGIDPILSCIPALEHLVLQINPFWNKEYREIDNLVDILGTTPWLELGRRGNPIKRVELTAEYWEWMKKMIEGAEKFRNHIEGVNIVIRDDSPWGRDEQLHGQYVDFGFDDLSFVLG
ncbi:hypothetical protein GALMADRAFT_160408 [Galerina marginata CBS 339.88]|uniref:Uncharacterized protein n=1 Tax=Galerina marginata (strain CBS 339.88) TaxID=685588 RepID=A0A067SEL1_GALM3|nr:hypothetical protein GALMADRAFT_160408 [Galerina marginata CBS 339.88]